MIVSNSDMEVLQRCEWMFYYSKVLNLNPRELSINIRKGSYGHHLMETGFQVILDGGTVQEALEAVAAESMTQLEPGGEPEFAKLYKHVSAFIQHVDEMPWRIVALEDKAMWNIYESKPGEKTPESKSDPFVLLFGYTPDLIIEFTQGPRKGQYAVIDFKFLGQYMKEVAVNMAQQIPKYMIYRNLAHPDQPIRIGAFVQLNTRANINDKGFKLFLTKWVTPKPKRLERIRHENELLARQVAEMYKVPKENLIHTTNKSTCEWCFFAEDLCPAEFDGASQSTLDKIIAREYVQNDYGY